MPDLANDTPGLTIIREARETRVRARLGGVFYALAALFSLGANGAARQDVTVDVVASAVFLGLAVLRIALGRGRIDDLAQARRNLRRVWSVVLLTATLWGAFAAYQVARLPDSDAADLAWMCSVAFATAMAHAFSMRRNGAAIAILMLYAPMLVVFIANAPGWAQPAAMAVYLAYLFLVLSRSHAEYLAGERLDQQLRTQRDQYERQSRRDPLTEVFNRRRFQAELDRFIAQVAIAPATFALLLVDIDHFKRVNDRHGHAAGDACLVHFARQLQAAFGGPGEIVARLGGEEFGVLLPHTGVHEARTRAESLRLLVANEPVMLGDVAIPLTCSIGVSVADHDAVEATAMSLYRAADAALYAAKSAGRNRVSVATN